MYETDSSVETEGVELEYGNTVITIARAGGANKKFSKKFAELMQPHKRAIELGSFPERLAQKILYKVYADTIILNWQVENGEGELVTGIFQEDVDGGEGIAEFTKENVIAVFKKLPDLFTDIRNQSDNIALFRKNIEEAEKGN